MASHKVEIKVNSANKLEYLLDGAAHPSGASFHVNPGDDVRWFSKAEKFGIHFADNHSPFVGDTFLTTAEKSTSDTGSGHKPTPPLGVRTHVFDTTYKYFVASAKTSGPKHVVTDDPEIIVDGTGGGGP
jgi:hypothetical protein